MESFARRVEGSSAAFRALVSNRARRSRASATSLNANPTVPPCRWVHLGELHVHYRVRALHKRRRHQRGSRLAVGMGVWDEALHHASPCARATFELDFRTGPAQLLDSERGPGAGRQPLTSGERRGRRDQLDADTWLLMRRAGAQRQQKRTGDDRARAGATSGGPASSLVVAASRWVQKMSAAECEAQERTMPLLSRHRGWSPARPAIGSQGACPFESAAPDPADPPWS